MTRACTSSDTDPPPARWPGRPGVWAVLALLLSAGGGPAAADTSAADLRALLEKIDKTLSQAEKAIKDTYPGKVGYILIHLDELLDEFQKDSGLESLVKTFDD